MKEKIHDRCLLLLENKKVFEECFSWKSDFLTATVAALFASAGVLVTRDKVKECKRILKRNSNAVSTFKGSSQIIIIGKMVLADDPEAYLKKVMDVFEIVKDRKIISGSRKELAIATLAESVEMDNIEYYLSRIDELNKKLKKSHAVSSNDNDTSILLALSDKDIDVLISDMEKNHTILKRRFSDRKSVRTLSYLLTLSDDDPEVKCEKIKDLYNKLLRYNLKFDVEKELGILAPAVLIDVSPELYASYVKDAYDIMILLNPRTKSAFNKNGSKMLAIQIVTGLLIEGTSPAVGTIINRMITEYVKVVVGDVALEVLFLATSFL